MSRIKIIRPAALFLCVMLAIAAIRPAFAADAGFRPDDEDLYFSALNEEIKEDVKTIEVGRGDFTLMSSCKGEIVYDNVTYCMNTLAEGSVRYVRMLVKNGDWVKRGDPIVEVSATVEEADLESLRTQIAVEEQNLDVRTITMGISLLDCVSDDIVKLCDNIYNKITTDAAANITEKIVAGKSVRGMALAKG